MILFNFISRRGCRFSFLFQFYLFPPLEDSHSSTFLTDVRMSNPLTFEDTGNFRVSYPVPPASASVIHWYEGVTMPDRINVRVSGLET